MALPKPQHNSDGSVEYYDDNGDLHYDEECSWPARMDHYHNVYYYLHGALHRPGDMPACIENSRHTIHYYNHGELHRINTPAVIKGVALQRNEPFLATHYPVWVLQWYDNGRLHRDTDVGPASVTVDWTKNTVTLIWYTYGQIDRTYGPAYVRYAIEAFPEHLITQIIENNELENMCLEELEHDGYIGAMEVCWMQMDMYHRSEDDGPAVIYGNGTRVYYYKNQIHRTSSKGPSVLRANGYIAYMENGQLHRLGDMPAVTDENGDEYYYQYGKAHRTGDLPCVDTKTQKEWRVRGCYVPRPKDAPNLIFHTQKPSELDQYEWRMTLQRDESDDAKLLDDIDDLDELDDCESDLHEGVYHVSHRNNGPAVIRHNGDEEYYVHGNLHRTNGPAITYDDGTQAYYFNGLYHNPMGPARVNPNIGLAEYRIYGDHTYPFCDAFREAENEAWHAMVGSKRMREAHFDTVLEETRRVRRAIRKEENDESSE